MAQFEWKSEYSVGDETLDAQHREMVRIMNELHELLQEPAEAEVEGRIAFIFGSLADYIATHFAYEEERMVDARYPYEKLVAHRVEHHELVKKVRRFHADVAEGNREGLLELMPYLYGEWLVHHICQQDMDYKPFMDARRIELAA